MMSIFRTGEEVRIHSYKHNGLIHRGWDNTIVLEEKEDYIVLANEKSKVTESDGRSWYTREPAVLYFFKDKWYNVIGMIREDGIYYYCNISTPYLIDDKVVKYIDYDLDLKVFPDGTYRILDEEEYKYHKGVMGYSEELDKILHDQLDDLIAMVEDKRGPFAQGFINYWYIIYKNNYRNKRQKA